MSKDLIQSILKITGVISVLIGAIMISSAVAAAFASSQAISQFTGGQFPGQGNLVAYGIFAAGMPIYWGMMLYWFSPKIAFHIHARQDVA
jgi:hypothetical protein